MAAYKDNQKKVIQMNTLPLFENNLSKTDWHPGSSSPTGHIPADSSSMDSSSTVTQLVTINPITSTGSTSLFLREVYSLFW